MLRSCALATWWTGYGASDGGEPNDPLRTTAFSRVTSLRGRRARWAARDESAADQRPARGRTGGGPRLVARDNATGSIVGSVDPPSGTVGTPMTYLVESRQYIGVTVGGGPRLIALALPD